MSKRVCVIGGGISGLCVAFRLKQANNEIVLFERNAVVGGNIQSITQDGFLYEHGPNSTLTSRELLDLIDDLGISDQIAASQPAAKKRFIVRDGRLVGLPSNPITLILTKAFSASSKLSLLKEPFRRNSGPADESAAGFFERRLGREIVDYAVDPFISGIYAGDPDKLSIEHAFPRLYELERDFGSIVVGGIRSPKSNGSKLPKGTPRSLSFKNGMRSLVNALEGKLGGSIRANCGDLQIAKVGDNQIEIKSTDGSEIFDAVVICTPAYVAGDLIDKLDADLSRELSAIYYPPVSVVYTGFKREEVGFDPAGFGFLVPGIEDRRILGTLWTSSIFEGRAPDGYHLFTTFVGGSRNPELGHSSEAELLHIAIEELRSLMNVTGDPVFSAVKKWPRAIPQYNVGYGSVIEAIEKFRSQTPEIFLCGNYYKGISVSDCVKNGGITAVEVEEFLTSSDK